MLAAPMGLVDRAEWLAKGYVQGQRDLFMQQLEHRFAAGVTADVRALIANASPELIERWSAKLLDADALADVFPGESD